MEGLNCDRLYVGTYTDDTSEGIYLVHIDENGKLEVADLAAKLQNPTYMVLSGDGRYLYSIIETESFNGKPGGAVAAFKTDSKAGSLELLNITSTIGKGPCHLASDSLNRCLYTANYLEGSVTAFRLNTDGSIGNLISHIHHQGSGPDKNRQEGPHAHCVVLSPDEKVLYSVDLGIDRIVPYRLEPPVGEISPNYGKSACIRPGSGPRHLVFHRNKKYAYLINELSSDLVVMDYSMESGDFDQKQYISTLPDKFDRESYCAALKISPDGKYLYASNRGHDSIAIYRIKEDSGTLEICGYQSTLGSYPRDFEINPSGTLLVAANQISGTLVSFHIDRETGLLEPTGNIASLDAAVCVKFL